MATFTSSQAAASVPAKRHDLAGVMQTAVGKISVTSNPADGDIYKLVDVPANCIVIGGYAWTTDLDTNATETLDIDFGWADNGGASETLTDANGVTWTNMSDGNADPDGLSNSGVLTGDAITDLTSGGNVRLFNMQNGPVYFSRKTTIQAEANAAAATFAAGTITAVVYFIVP